MRRTRSTRASSCSTTATTRASSGCSRGSMCPGQPSEMSFAVSDEAATSSMRAPPPMACSPSARTWRRPGSTGWWPTWCASTATRGSCSRRDDKGPSLGHWLEEHGLLAAFIDRLIVPQAAAVWSADPRQMWTLPRALPGSSSSTTTGCSASAIARAGAPSAAARTRYVEALVRPWRDRLRLSTPVQAIQRQDDHVAVTPARRRARALRRGGPGHALRPGARLARRRRASASTSCSARSPTSPTRRCCTPTPACCRAAGAPGRAGTTTCSTSHRGKPTVTYHMNRLQSLRRRARVLRDAQPHRARSTRSKVIRTISYAHPVYTQPARPRRRATTRSADATARTSAAPTGAGASTRTACERRAGGRALRGRDAVIASAIYDGTIRHRRFADRARRVPASASRWPTSTSTSCPACSVAGSSAPGPGSCASVAATTWATRRGRSTRRCARSSRSGPAPAGRGPIRLLTHLRTFGHCFNPVSFYYCFDGRRRAARHGRRRGDQHALGRAPRLRAAATATTAP